MNFAKTRFLIQNIGLHWAFALALKSVLQELPLRNTTVRKLPMSHRQMLNSGNLNLYFPTVKRSFAKDVLFYLCYRNKTIGNANAWFVYSFVSRPMKFANRT